MAKKNASSFERYDTSAGPEAIPPEPAGFYLGKDSNDPIPHGNVSLDSIICTEELRRRPSRAPDYQIENRALVALSSALADTILELCRCGSAGISLLTVDDGGKRFHWPAIAGAWTPHIGGGTPRDF